MKLKLDLENAKEAYKKGSADIKKFLEDCHPEHFKGDVKEKVTSYESSCKLLGVTPKTLSQFEQLFDKDDAKRQFSRHKIATGIKAINDGWVADFENENQRKYYNWQYNKNSGFSFHCVCHYFFCLAGSDLYIESEEKAKIIQKVFKDDYIIYFFGY